MQLGKAVEQVLSRRNGLQFRVLCSNSPSVIYKWAVREASRTQSTFTKWMTFVSGIVWNMTFSKVSIGI